MPVGSRSAWAIRDSFAGLGCLHSLAKDVDSVEHGVEFLIAGFAACAGISAANKAQYCDHLCGRCKISDTNELAPPLNFCTHS